MDARIYKAIMRSGAVFCVLIFLYWAIVSFSGETVPVIQVLLMFPGLEYVLPWEVSRWFDPLGAFAMTVTIAAVCGSSLVSDAGSAMRLGTGVVGGMVFGLLVVPAGGFISAAYTSCALGGGMTFGVSVGTAQRTERIFRSMEAAYAYGIGSGLGMGVVASVSLGTVIGCAYAILLFATALATGGICTILFGLIVSTPSAARRTFRWLSGN